MEQENINKRLDRIEKMLELIQENMIDIDVIITDEEKKMLDQSIENERLGKLISSEKLRKEFEI